MHGFSCHTRVISGEGALSHLRSLSSKRILVVTDTFFSKSGTAAQIAGLIPDAAVQIFDKVTPDPDVELVAHGVSAISNFDPDCILALGGGSPMDCAKAMKYIAESRAPLIAIPTTSGTGSEVTTFAIITKDGTKLPIVDDSLAPDLAILDPSLLSALPKTLIADAGFDILAHCVEAVAATNATTMSSAMAQNAFACTYQNLLRSYQGDTSVRQAIHEAACMAGIAFNNAGLGLCHALSHALGGQFHIAHGRLNAILLPAVMEYHADTCLARYATIAHAAGIAGSTDRLRLRNLLSGLRRLRAALSLPDSLKQAGIERNTLEDALPSICSSAQNDRCLQTSPIKTDVEAMRKILLAVAE